MKDLERLKNKILSKKSFSSIEDVEDDFPTYYEPSDGKKCVAELEFVLNGDFYLLKKFIKGKTNIEYKYDIKSISNYGGKNFSDNLRLCELKEEEERVKTKNNNNEIVEEYNRMYPALECWSTKVNLNAVAYDNIEDMLKNLFFGYKYKLIINNADEYNSLVTYSNGKEVIFFRADTYDGVPFGYNLTSEYENRHLEHHYTPFINGAIPFRNALFFERIEFVLKEFISKARYARVGESIVLFEDFKDKYIK